VLITDKEKNKGELFPKEAIHLPIQQKRRKKWITAIQGWQGI